MQKIFCLLILCTIALHGKAQEKTYRLFFAFNEYTLPDSALLPLIKLVHTAGLERILIEGHCDSIGSLVYNQKLSEKRAAAVKQFLMTNGIAEKQIKTCLGKGETQPMRLNISEAERQLNRRVDITLYYKEATKDSLKITKRSTNHIQKKQDTLLAFDEAVVGEQIQLKELYFIPGRHIIKMESYSELVRLLKTMLHYKTVRIEIQGHVCCASETQDGYDWDTETYNLSENRAAAVAEFLIQGGVSAKRLVIKGYGGSQKISRDETEEEQRALNRRVVCKILSK